MFIESIIVYLGFWFVFFLMEGEEVALSLKRVGLHIVCNVNSSKIIEAVEMRSTVHLRTQGPVPGGKDSSTLHSSLPSGICVGQTVP